MIVRHVKRDHFMPGVPARDLSSDEWDAVPERMRVALLKQGIYEIDPDAEWVDPTPAPEAEITNPFSESGESAGAADDEPDDDEGVGSDEDDS